MTSPSTDATVRTVVVGAGQSGLATGFYLRRYGLEPGVDFVILDAADRPGGAWRHMWEGLRLFSPASASALPGWPMPPWDDAAKGYPPARHVVDYLTRYEERYDLKVRRPFTVTAVEDPDDGSRRLLVRGVRRHDRDRDRGLDHWDLGPALLADLSGDGEIHGSPAPCGAVPTAGGLCRATGRDRRRGQLRGPGPRRGLNGGHHGVGDRPVTALPAR